MKRWFFATFTVTNPAGAVGQWENVWTHDYMVIVNLDGTFGGTGHARGEDENGSVSLDETITGKFNTNETVTLTASHGGFSYSLADAGYGDQVTLATVSPVYPWLIEMKVTEPVFSTTCQNHGDSVSQCDRGADAAHSPIGKPINADQ
jgi:hypothetical protein